MKNWDEVKRATTDQILAWAETQPWAMAMANCQQDPEWHSEGDVWTHTRLAVAKVERLSEWPSLDRDEQVKLLFTALLHDAGNGLGFGVRLLRPASRTREGTSVVFRKPAISRGHRRALRTNIVDTPAAWRLRLPLCHRRR